MRLVDGTVITSIAPKVRNPAVETCHETGALCEAYKLDKDVVASVCVIRSSTRGDFWIGGLTAALASAGARRTPAERRTTIGAP